MAFNCDNRNSHAGHNLNISSVIDDGAENNSTQNGRSSDDSTSSNTAIVAKLLTERTTLNGRNRNSKPRLSIPICVCVRVELYNMEKNHMPSQQLVVCARLIRRGQRFSIKAIFRILVLGFQGFHVSERLKFSGSLAMKLRQWQLFGYTIWIYASVFHADACLRMHAK